MIRVRGLIEEKVKRYHEAIRKASNDVVAGELLKDMKRWLLRNDLFFLMCVTGHEKIAKWRGVYQPFCDEVSLQTWQVVRLGIHEGSDGMMKWDEVADEEDFGLERMYLCYRAFYKTSIVTIGHSCQLLLNFPNIHIVLCHNKQDTSSKNLMAVKNLFLNTPKLNDETVGMLKERYGVS